MSVLASPSSLGATLATLPPEKATSITASSRCRMLQQKTPTGEDLKCVLTKTWGRSTIKEADRTELTWGFGDARCSIELNVSRAVIVAAVTSSKPFKLWVPPHTANCVVEQDGQLKPIRATVAPKIVFKDGRAEKIWINLMHIDGPA